MPLYVGTVDGSNGRCLFRPGAFDRHTGQARLGINKPLRRSLIISICIPDFRTCSRCRCSAERPNRKFGNRSWSLNYPDCAREAFEVAETRSDSRRKNRLGMLPIGHYHISAIVPNDPVGCLLAVWPSCLILLAPV